MNKYFCFVIAVLLAMIGEDLSMSVITAKTSVSQMVRDSGYPLEEITLETPDGYRLTMHRLPGGKKSPLNPTLPPVLILHGLGGNAADFVIMGPKRSLAYLLADAGYDVFLGNMRFNLYASHVNISKSDPKYWDFGLDEHGKYDIPSMMEKVLTVTNSTGLHYVGYSMGSTVYMMACSTRPDLAEKIVSFVGLAPAVHMDNFQPLAKIAFNWQVPKILKEQGINPIYLGGRYQRALSSGLCSPKLPSRDLCMALIFLFIGEDYDQIDWDIVPIVMSKFQPVSLKQIIHYGQLALTDKLMYFDYGSKENLARYGSKKPPMYDMKANKAQVALFYGNNDKLTPPNEIKELAEQYKMINITVITKRVPWKKFNHYDFIVAKDLPTLVNNDIIHFLNTIIKPSHKYRDKGHRGTGILHL